MRFAIELIAFLALSTVTTAQPKPVNQIPVPGSPFRAIFSMDSRSIFVSESGGIGVLAHSVSTWSYVRTIPLSVMPTGLTLTHDGSVLIAATDDGVTFWATKSLISGVGEPKIGSIEFPKKSAPINLIATNDDKFLFVSDEDNQTIAVVNLAKALANGPASEDIIGQIPVGIAPIGLAFSPDESLLYTTSERAPDSFGWLPDSSSEVGSERKVTQGAVITIDVKVAETDPSHAVRTQIPSGSSPVRLVLSTDGSLAFVTVRGGNSVYVFDTAKLIGSPEKALVAKAEVGPSPVGIAVLEGGKTLLVACSDRFAKPEKAHPCLVVIDATNASTGKLAVLGQIPTGAFPREISLSPDGHTVVLTNFDSKTVEILPVEQIDALTTKIDHS